MKFLPAIALLLLLWPTGSVIAQPGDSPELGSNGANTLFSESNLQWQRKLTGICSPVAFNGRVFSLGAIGDAKPKLRLNCYGSDGERQWRKSVWTPSQQHLSSARLITNELDRVGVAHNEGLQIRDVQGKHLQRLEHKAGRGRLNISSEVSLDQVFFLQPSSTAVQDQDFAPGQLCVAYQREHVKGNRYIGQRYLEIATDSEVVSVRESTTSQPFAVPDKEYVKRATENTKKKLQSLSYLEFKYESRKGSSDIQRQYPYIEIIPIEESIRIAYSFFQWNGTLGCIGGDWLSNSTMWQVKQGDNTKSFSIASDAGETIDNKLLLISQDRLFLLVLHFDKQDIEIPRVPKKSAKQLENNNLLHWIYWQEEPIASLLHHGEHIYLVNVDGTLACLETNTKKVCYRKKLFPAQTQVHTPVAHKGHIYIAERNGSIVSFKSGPEFREQSTAKLNEVIVGSPVFSNDSAYIQTAKSLYSFYQSKDYTGNKSE